MPGIYSETPPTAGRVRIGIEIEGVGTVSTRWDRPTVVREDNFKHVFKRMQLVRSNSIGASRGVYIAPETGKDFGRNSPAELVSSPHLFNAASLIHLRNSVWKAMSSRGQRTGQAAFQDPREPVDPRPPVATSRWGVNRLSQIGGSLQTTIGVSVHRLLNRRAATRNAVFDLLIGDPNKRQAAKQIAAGAVAAQRALCEPGQPLYPYAGRRFGIRYVIFSYLVYKLAGVLAGGASWGKDALGCNFKGYTSFIGNGVAASNEILVLGARDVDQDDVLDLMANAMLEAGMPERLVYFGLIADEDDPDDEFPLEHIGRTGLSMQTSGEGWYAIPNFTHGGKLFTVIECREKTARLNVEMRNFLNDNKKVVDPDSRSTRQKAMAFRNRIATITGA